MEMNEMEFYKMAYQGLDELAAKVAEAKDYAASKFNKMMAEMQAAVQQPVVQPEPVKEEKTPTTKKEK